MEIGNNRIEFWEKMKPIFIGPLIDAFLKAEFVLFEALCCIWSLGDLKFALIVQCLAPLCLFFSLIVVLKGLKVQNFHFRHSEVTLSPSDSSFESVFSSAKWFCASGLELSVLVSHLPS